MKRLFAFIAIFMFVLALSVTPATAASTGVGSGISATSTAVTLTAIVPEYIGFSNPSISSVTFGTPTGVTPMGSTEFNAAGLARGESDVSVWVSTLPTWVLTYNLANRPTVTVYAYVSDLNGSEGTISGTAVTGTSMVLGGPQRAFGAAFTQPNSLLLDTIPSATFSEGAGKVEGFSQLGMHLPIHMTPGTYTGIMNIVAQTI